MEGSREARGVFVTATGTDVGKTYVCALLLQALRSAGLRAGYYKAAASGAERRGALLAASDAEVVRERAGLDTPVEKMVSYVYTLPLSPHLAARIEGNPPELEVIRRDFAAAASGLDYVVVEGSGGIVCPLRVDGEQTLLLADVVRALGLDVLIVTPSGLGAINSAVTTCAYAERSCPGVRGFVMNRFHAGDVMEEDNRVMIEKLSGKPVLACVPEGGGLLPLSPALLDAIFGGGRGG